MENNFYVYIYLDPRKSGRFEYNEYCFLFEPFYVGKGRGKRWKKISDRSNYFKRKINKIKLLGLKPIIFKIEENLFGQKSLNLEIKLINEIGRKDLNNGPLVNLTDGGDGTSGYKFTEETKEIISQKLRIDFNIIIDEFKNRGYKLLTKKEEYINNKQCLEYICPREHYGTMAWNDFHKNKNCPKCVHEDMVIQQRKDFSVIEKTFKDKKYKLLTKKEEYVNNKTKLKYICPREHYGEICWNDFFNDHICPICANENGSKKRRKNFDNIVKVFVENDFILITKECEYINNKQKLEYVTLDGEYKHISWNEFHKR